MVFIWFGALEVFDVTPVTDLLGNTVYWVDPDWFVPALVVVEVLVEIATILQIDQGLHRRLTVQVIGACGKAWVDPGRVRQIIRNLLTNADRYGGDQVRVILGDTDGGVAIAVEDNGPGIPEGMRDTIFEPYGRAHAERTQPASVGLGLAVARSLARMMGGDLIHERRGDTTVFELQLLAAAADSGFGGTVLDIA